MTVYHYTNWPPRAFAGGLLPGSSATDYDGWTSESASVGLGIVPPTLVYPVTFDPVQVRFTVDVVPPNKFGAGGLIEYYFPNGTPRCSVGHPKSVPTVELD